MRSIEPFVKLFRKFLEWEWYSDINTSRLFLHLLLRANWKHGTFKGKVIERGQLASSLDILSRETGLTVNEIRTGIKHLKSTGEITSKSYSKFTVFTVVKYNSYQEVNKQLTGTDAGTSHPVNKLLTTIEEKKEVKKERNKKGAKAPKEKSRFPGNDLLDRTFSDFIMHRKAMKKPMTEIAIDRMIKKLNKFDGDAAINALERSIENGWQGVFPEKEAGQKGAGNGCVRSNAKPDENGLIQGLIAKGVGDGEVPDLPWG